LKIEDLEKTADVQQVNLLTPNALRLSIIGKNLKSAFISTVLSATASWYYNPNEI
jgi:hypothetical protein